MVIFRGCAGDNNQKSASVSDKELLKFYLHQYRARIHIMSRSMKASKREIKSGTVETPNVRAVPTSAACLAEFLVGLVSAHRLIRTSARAHLCRPLLAAALNIRNQNVTALFLKSNYEYVRRNYRKAVKLLNSCPKTNAYVSGQSLAVLYFNNLGCVHFKVHLACALMPFAAYALLPAERARPAWMTCCGLHGGPRRFSSRCVAALFCDALAMPKMGKYAMAGLYFRKAIEANEREAGRMPQGTPFHL